MLEGDTKKGGKVGANMGGALPASMFNEIFSKFHFSNVVHRCSCIAVDLYILNGRVGNNVRLNASQVPNCPIRPKGK